MDNPHDSGTPSPDLPALRKVVALRLGSVAFGVAGIVFLVLGLVETFTHSIDAGKVVPDALPELLASVVFSLLALALSEWASRIRKGLRL